MKWEKDQVYECAVAACGCEVTVTKSPAAGRGGEKPPTCCCGQAMKLKTKVS